MAKIRHNNIVDTINDIAKQARERGISHLQFTGKEWDGRFLTIDDRKMYNFGTCGYLGLESHPKVKQLAIEYTSDFGTQYSISRAYASAESNEILEGLLSKMFLGSKTLVFSSTTIAHISVLPIVIRPGDAIIMDQQAHVSMQTAAQLVAVKGVPIEVVRHSNVEMVEHLVKKLRSKHNRIWYIIDGVYSMYGDIAPMTELNVLAEKYECLHFYVDDAHGMSWAGINGSGAVFEKFLPNGKTLLVTTMAKGFGSVGGIVVFPNEDIYEEVSLHGGALAYSHPIVPAVLGASTASAEIHLSDEIFYLQEALESKLQYCNSLLEKTEIPVLSDPRTPIYFLGTGQPNVGYNMNKRILDEGFYVNIGIFPAVPVKNTGLRFTITNHLRHSDIEAFVQALAYHYPKALEEEGKTVNQVRKAFRMKEVSEHQSEVISPQDKFRVEVHRSIEQVDKGTWKNCFPEAGNYTWEALYHLEEAMSGNVLEEDNWDFYYVFVYDNETLVLASFLTSGIMKDDLTSPAGVSMQLEDIRQNDKYYLCSKTLMMGSLITEGSHLFLKRESKNWKEVLMKFVQVIYEIQEANEINNVVLRDFDIDDEDIEELFNDLGFFKMDMPNSNVIHDLNRDPHKEYLGLLSSKARRNIRSEVIKHFGDFSFEVKNELTPKELDLFIDLYRNVARKNYSINIFPYPDSLFHSFQKCSNWEYLILRAKSGKILSIISSYKDGKVYCPAVIGINYDHETESSVYKQIMYRTVLYARNKGYRKVRFGFSADSEKKKLGATQERKVAFMSVVDQFNLVALEKIKA